MKSTNHHGGAANPPPFQPAYLPAGATNVGPTDAGYVVPAAG